MRKKNKKGDRVKIEPQSQAAIEVFRNDKAREKWENTGRIGFVTDVTTAPAKNKLIRVGTHPEDKNGDYFFPGDLRELKPGEGEVYLVIEHPYGVNKTIYVCTSKSIAEYIRDQNSLYRIILPAHLNERIYQ